MRSPCAGEFLCRGRRASIWPCAPPAGALKYAEDRQDIQRVEDLLWQTALGLEQGGLLTAAEELRRLQQALPGAGPGAPQDEIDALLQRYQALLTLSSGAGRERAAERRAARSHAKVLGQQDLAALLKAIQQLSQSGDAREAQQMLAMLQKMLENMQVAGRSRRQQSGRRRRGDAIGKLGDLMGKQRMLLDKTFRQSRAAAIPRMADPKAWRSSKASCRTISAPCSRKPGRTRRKATCSGPKE